MKTANALMLIVLLAASSMFYVESVSAQSIPKPSVPEFTVRYVDRSYDIPATYNVNPYTGDNEITQDARHVQYKTIELAIKNPAFTPYKDQENHSIDLYYSVRMKGHYDGSWFYLDDGYYGTDNHYVGSDQSTQYTTFSYGLVGNEDEGLRCVDIPEGGQADLQVQAFVGYNTKISDGMTMFGELYHYVFTGGSSDWSQAQTVTIDDNSVLNGTIELNGEQIALVVACGIIAVLTVALILSRRRRA